MAMQKSLPSYVDLFGNVDFKEGDDARSVYSPAAYLSDLLQMLDDEFDQTNVDFAQRREDIKEITLDAENTTTLIPYLDVVNEVLERKLEQSLSGSTDDSGNDSESDVYSEIAHSVYPFNLPFSLDHEKTKIYLKHLDISPRSLYRLFATDVDYFTVAREYLGFSKEALSVLLQSANSTTADADEVARLYGYSGEDLVGELSIVSVFMEKTGLRSHEMRELLYQNLYINPSNHRNVERGRDRFYINTGMEIGRGYVRLNEDETKLEWYGPDTEAPNALPLAWFERASRFIRFAQTVSQSSTQTTDLSFTDLDRILRNCCRVDGVPTLNTDTLTIIAQVIYIHKTLEHPIETVVALLSELSLLGQTNEPLPQDQFNRVFNLPCISVDKRYLSAQGSPLDSEPNSDDGSNPEESSRELSGELTSNSLSNNFNSSSLAQLPPQYIDNPYHAYSPILYYENLFSDENEAYRERLRHTLEFTPTDLINITNRLKFEQVAENSLWENPAYQWQLLNVLYRIRTLSDALEVHFLELFTLFDLIEQDPFIGRRDPHTYFVYSSPSTQKCFEILMARGSGIAQISDRLWLLESLIALNRWMKALGYTPEVLWNIVNGTATSDRAQTAKEAQDLALFNTLLQSFKAQEIQPDTLKETLGDERAARFAYSLIKTKCGKARSHVLFAYNPREVKSLTADFIRQFQTIEKDEFVDLRLETKLQEKILRNLINHKVIDGSGRILTENLVNRKLPPREQFMLAYDFSDWQQAVWDVFSQVYQTDKAALIDADDTVEVQIFKSDLKDLGLSESEAKELYDNLIYNNYIDEQGFAKDALMFGAEFSSPSLMLNAGLQPLTHQVYDWLQQQIEKFEASQVTINEQLFADLALKPNEQKSLLENLMVNRYIDEQMRIVDKMRLLMTKPDTLSVSLQFYPHREEILNRLQGAITVDQQTWLQVDLTELGKMAAMAVSCWIYEDLQSQDLEEGMKAKYSPEQYSPEQYSPEQYSPTNYPPTQFLHGNKLHSHAEMFFKNEENRAALSLRPYFDTNQTATVFDHIAAIVSYADDYRLKEEKLTALDFDAIEIENLQDTLEDAQILDTNGFLRAEQVAFFLQPDNAATFDIPSFEDYDTEVFFCLHEAARMFDTTVRAVDDAMRTHSQAQQAAVVEQLKSALGLETEAVEMVSKAVFKTENNLHFAWLSPLLESANALGQLTELPDNKSYRQAVKRIQQLALLIDQQQLDQNVIALALRDQNLIAKFPDTLILPNGISTIDALLESEEFVYLFSGRHYWIYLAEDYTLIDTSQQQDAALRELLLNRQKKDQARQKRLKEDPIRQLFDTAKLRKVEAAFIDRQGTWVIISGDSHYIRYAEADTWVARSNQFGQIDNDFDNLEMIDAAYLDAENRLFLFSNDKYIRYSDLNFTLDPEQQNSRRRPVVDPGYPKSIEQDWNQENLPIQLPPAFSRDLGPMFDGLDEHSYAFLDNQYFCSEDGEVRKTAQKWGHREHNFDHANSIDAALANQGHYLLFLADKVVKYAGSIELANLQPEAGYPKPLYQEFPRLSANFAAGIDAALSGTGGQTYLFKDDEFVQVGPEGEISEPNETRTVWGRVVNPIAGAGRVEAAFVGLDGYTYLFSGDRYVRYSGSDYSQVDDGFPRLIQRDWAGLTRVTAAFVLGNKTYLFGTDGEDQSIYVRYSTVRANQADRLAVDEKETDAREIAAVLTNRPDVDEIETFSTAVNEDFWSLPERLTGGNESFQIDAVMNGPAGKVYLFYGNYYVEHDYIHRWWSEPKQIAEGLYDLDDSNLDAIEDEDHVRAAFTGKDGKTYVFYHNRYLRFSDPELRTLDNGYPRLTSRFWGKVRNNIERTGQIDAAVMVASRWEQQNRSGQLYERQETHTYLFSGDQIFRYAANRYNNVEPGYPRNIRYLSEEPRFQGLQVEFSDGIDAAFADQRQVYLFQGNRFHVVAGEKGDYQRYDDAASANVQAVTQSEGMTYVLTGERWQKLNHLENRLLRPVSAIPRVAQKTEGQLSASIDAVLSGTDGREYVFASDRYYDVSLERSFEIADVWGRSRNPIYDDELIDAAFVGRDGITYIFSGEWFVEYDTPRYIQQPAAHPPKRIHDQWHGLQSVAFAYVVDEETFIVEHPDASGNFRYLRYTEDSYDRPDSVYLERSNHSDMWNIPQPYQAEGFDHFDAIFVDGDNLLFIRDQQFISYNLNTNLWSYPQPLRLAYPGIPFNKTDFRDLTSAFIGADGSAYFFGDQCYVAHTSETDSWSEISMIREDWGLQRNSLARGVDAAWVSSERVTYLFAQDQYVRYSGSDYRYIDAGYPKAIAAELRNEPAFAFMSEEFQEHLDALTQSSNAENDDTPAVLINGIVDNTRCLYIFSQDALFVGSPNRHAAYDIDGLGRIDNNFTLGGYIDAAFVDTQREYTYLFSGEQYIRYTGDRYRYIDEGYPKVIAESLAAELGVERLDEDYRDGLDAAVYLSHLGLVLFNEQHYLNIRTRRGETQTLAGDINQTWGYLKNTFDPANARSPRAQRQARTVDGAYVDPSGRLHVLKADQVVRYSDTAALFSPNPENEMRYVDAEFPQAINDIWPRLDRTLLADHLIEDEESESDGSTQFSLFQFEDEIYFQRAGNFVTYALDRRDRTETKPVQVLAYRWGEWSDYLLSDIYTISKFQALNLQHSGAQLSLAGLLNGTDGEVKEPYMQLAAIFGFEKEAVRWVKQQNAFLPMQVNAIETDFHLEEILRLYDILSTAQRIRVEPSALYHRVWQPLYEETLNGASNRTAALATRELLLAVDCDNNYETLAKQITNEINTLKRDALVPYAIDQMPDISSPRQLYQKLLIDIQMESCAETSRIKEATAAIQLYLHRYFINLEDISLTASDQEATRLTLKERWRWLRNYRVWEANRKVFLYPENYIRPELRDNKSGGFKSLEESLSQGELTDQTVESAYLKYLDNFTEVSELTISGGYVYDETGTNDKKLVLFGRTRIDPRRYFYRFGTFVGGDSAAAVWSPWEPMEIAIEAVRVEPVYAFNRLFVFWAITEEKTSEPESAQINISGSDSNKRVSAEGNMEKEIKVFYSFYNLNKQWTQPQLLKTTFDGRSALRGKDIIDVDSIFVENSAKLSQNSESHAYENIYIGVRYWHNTLVKTAVETLPETLVNAALRTAVVPTDRPVISARSERAAFSTSETVAVLATKAFNLTPELYSQPVNNPQLVENPGRRLFDELFPQEGGIEELNTVMLNYSANSTDGPWFAYNQKGCGLLVKPAAIALPNNTQLARLNNNRSLPQAITSLPRGVRITAAVQPFTNGDTYYFLNNSTYLTVSADNTVTSAPIKERWGNVNTSPMQSGGTVDAAFTIKNASYLTLAGEIYEYDGSSFATLIKEPYPLSDLIENLPPAWRSIDAAFTTGTASFYFNNTTGEVLRSDTGEVKSIRSAFGLLSDEAGLTAGLSAAAVVGSLLHVVEDGQYRRYTLNGQVALSEADPGINTVSAVLSGIFAGRTIAAISGLNRPLVGMMLVGGGVWTLNDSGQRHYMKSVNGSVESVAVPAPFDQNIADQLWQSGLSYVSPAGEVHHIVFYDRYQQLASGENTQLAKAWSSNRPVDFGSGGNLEALLSTNDIFANNRAINIFENFIFNSPDTIRRGVATGSFDRFYNADLSKLYAPGVNVTAAFTVAEGTRIVIVTDQNTYHLFDHSQSPTEILQQLSARTHQGLLANLPLNAYLNTSWQNNIWQDNKVDAAFVGTGQQGIANALYLFRGDQYLRFTPTAATGTNAGYRTQADSGYPKVLSTNEEGFPRWNEMNAAFASPVTNPQGQRVSYLFNNSSQTYYRSDTNSISTTQDIWGVVSLTHLQTQQRVDAAYVFENYLHLFVTIEGDYKIEHYRYRLSDESDTSAAIARYLDSGYPKLYNSLGNSISAAFVLDDHAYLFATSPSGPIYYRLGEQQQPADNLLFTQLPLSGNWGNLPTEIRQDGLDAAFRLRQDENGVARDRLYFIQGDRYISYDLSDDKQPQPYEISSAQYEVIRLTSSTAEQLNQMLFSGGVDRLLQMSTQEINESPTISYQPSAPQNIQLNPSRFRTEPVNSHLDFSGALSAYYWEVFFHAPFLIAQTLNTDQQFESAKRWYEYIFDPTAIADYWRFLPFLAADPDALMSTLENDLASFSAIAIQDNRTVSTAQTARTALAAKLASYQKVFLGDVNLDLYEQTIPEAERLANIASWPTFTALVTAINNLNTRAAATAADNHLLSTWQSEMHEVIEILRRLDTRIDLMSNHRAQLSVYLSDPFDPHAIATLRRLAYRKAIVMRYIDNLLDWGDMLFRQYTRETIHEARMLYVLAYDLLGEKPQNMGQVVLSAPKSYQELNQFTDDINPDYEFLFDLENTVASEDLAVYEQSLSFAATQFDTITNPYFFLTENELFTEYWTRVEDRLSKIRACLNIDGVAQPLPLFQPPIDPMALVNAAASSGGLAAALAAGGVVSTPDYRFVSLMAKARELVGKLKSLGDNLLSTLEKKDSEELSMLQSKQESIILDLLTWLKELQIKEAEESLVNLQETRIRAVDQETHYANLITTGYLVEEKVQIGMMGAAAVLNGVSALGKIISGLSYVVPQFTAGPFSFGATAGGKNVGDMLTQFGEAVQSGAEGLSMGGEVAGVVAQFKRSAEDWTLQKRMATSEIKQIDSQIVAQQYRIEMSQQELVLHQREIDHHEAIATFMKSKFSNQQLYSWMSGKISSLFFQTYKLAHDYAKQAEQAFIFEKGITAGRVSYITGTYWDSQRQGLLSGARLDLDLDRMEKAYDEMDPRRLEITKNISLLSIDPMALLQLKTKGACTFRLSEELFDYDFPGHYNRQITTVSLAFDIGEGQDINATLTQLSSKLVMDTDIKAVKHLIDPGNEPTTNVRANWRANQQVALSHVDQYTENTGMFELNFGDERYLPFEGTGAVSSWRLELNGQKGSYNPADLLDVTLKLRYTAKQGGSRFANEVKGILKPYNATSFFDLAFNFTDDWIELTEGDRAEATLSFTPEMFPNLSSSKIVGLLIHYQYEGNGGGAIFTINDSLQVPHDTYLQPSALSVGRNGSDWTFRLVGDRTTLRNAEMVVVYKASV